MWILGGIGDLDKRCYPQWGAVAWVLLLWCVLLTFCPVHAQDSNITAEFPSELRFDTSKQSLLLQSLSDQERAWLAKHPVIRMGGESDWPPFDFVDEAGVYQGLTADYLALLSQRLGVEFEMVVHNPWAVTLDMLKHKELDAIGAIWRTPEREQFALFTKPYDKLSVVVFTRKENSAVSGIGDLRDATVAVVRDFATQGSLQRDYPEIVQLEVANTLEALEAVSQGRADAYIGTLAVSAYLLEKHFIANLKVAGSAPFDVGGVRLGVRDDWPELASILDKGLKSITEDERMVIRRRWISLTQPVTEPITKQVNLTAEERAWLERHPVIRVGSDPDWPPFDFIGDDGSPQGLSADYLALLAQRLGVKFQMVSDQSWSKTLGMLAAKELDIIGAIVQNPERESYALFTEPYSEFSSVIFSRRDAAGIAGIDDLTQTTVAIERGYSTHDTLQRDYPDISLLEVDTTLQALEAVSQGRADAYIGTLAVGSYLMEKHFISNLKVAANTPFDIGGITIGVRNDWPELVSILEKGLRSISAAERIDIRRRWVSLESSGLSAKTEAVELNQKEAAWLESHPKISLGVDSYWPPLEFFSAAGQYQGIAAEYIAYLNDVLDVSIDPEPGLAWSEVISRIKRGELDMLSAVGRTDSREEYLNFTEPYLTLPIVIFSHMDAHYVNSLNDLKDKRVIVEEAGYTYELLQEKHPELQLVTAENAEKALHLLVQGDGDVYVGNLMVASYLISQRGFANLKVAAPTQYSHDLHIAVRKDWPELIPIIQRALDRLTDEQKTAFQQKWLAIRYDVGVDYSLLWKVVAVALIIMLLGSFWLLQMRRQREALRRSDERFQLAMQATSDGLWDWNIITGDVYFSPAYMSMLGYQVDELAGRVNSWEALLHPDDKESALAVVAVAIARNAAKYEHEFRLRTKSGGYRNILSKGSVVAVDAQGRALRAVGTQTDVTERKQAEESLRKLSRAVEQSPSMVMITDCVGVIEYINPRFTEITGYSENEVIGQTPTLLRSGLTAAETYQDMWQTIRSGRNWQGELRNRKKSGEIYWERETISPLKSDDGEIRHYVALKEDISARKAAEEALLIFQRFAETSGQGFAITTLAGEITYANQTLCQMLEEASVADICRHNFSRYYPVEVLECFQQEIMPLVKENGQWTGELILVTATGNKIPTLENLFVIRDELGKALYFGNVITDITLQKRTEVALQNAKEQAEQASRFKSEFLANMSHEIRTPLNAIMGMTHLVQNTELTPRQHDYLDKVQSSSHGLLGVINDILDFSKIEAGRLEMEETDFILEKVFENLSNLESMRAAEKGIEIIYSFDENIPDRLVGDPLRLGQVLVNLTSNAIKFTERGQIVISVKLKEKWQDRVRLYFEVKDSGIGVEQQQVGHLFDPFVQADGSTTRKYGGTGLGLAISKQLVSMMKGEIGVESTLGSGSTFSFSAEFGCASDGQKKHYSLAPDLRGTRVLVVDDNASARDSLKDMLLSFSFDVTTVSSGAAALSELDRVSSEEPSQPYKLVLMDWMMPGMDGVQASRLIQESGVLPQLPTIIMVTAYGRDEVMQSAKHVGIGNFLIKPVSPSTLFDTIIGTLAPVSGVPALASQYKTIVPDLSGAHVLVVEDNRINQQVAKEMLEAAGIEVTVVNNGAAALQAVHAQAFDLVFMDVQMPDMDGYQTTRMIRKAPQFQQLPIVAMTAHAMTGDREKSLESGMNDHLSKPINPDLLYSTLDQWIELPERDVSLDTGPVRRSDDDIVPPVNLPGIDIEQGLLRIGGNRTLYRTLLSEFIEDHHNDDVALKEALAVDDFVLFRRLAHSLRGVAGSIGAQQLEERSGDLEQAISKGPLPSELFDLFATEFYTVMNGLDEAKEYLGLEIGVSPTDSGKDVTCWQGVRELEAMLEEGDTQARLGFSRCVAYLRGYVPDAQIALLEEQILTYDFDDALATLREVINRHASVVESSD